MSSNWKPLRSGLFGISAGDPGVDPMWVWADATNYRDHGPDGLGEPSRLWLALERPRAPGDDAARFVTREFSPAGWARVKSEFLRGELQLPVVPERAPLYPRRAVTDAAAYDPPRGESSTLVGVLDSGCPFASQILRKGAGPGCRVLGVWDQETESPAFTTCGGRRPAPHRYGCAIDRAHIDVLLARHFTRAGNVDEDAVYREAGYDIMRWGFSHGSAVVGQIFGRSLLGSAIQPTPGTPPPWDRDTTAIDGADLVFVDLSRRSMMDGTSAAVTRNLIDGLDFIESHIGAATRRIVVNLSIGTARTLHDGSSIVEQVLSDFVAKARRDGIERWVVLPMGNENLLQLHGVLSDADPESRLLLAIPPGSEMPQYVTIRWPEEAAAASWSLRITPPGGEPCDVARGEAFGLVLDDRPCCGAISARPSTESAAAMSLLAFAPTSSPDPDRALAPAGDWRIELVGPRDAAPLAEPVHFWISPNAQNPCMPKRSEQASFVDWNGQHQPQRWERLLYDDPALPVRNGLAHDSALNGMASRRAPSRRIVAVGGYVVLAGHQPASNYSSGGPGLGAAGSARRRPDVSAPADERWGGPGMSMRGSRSGSIARVMGTSFSVPLVVRAIANCGRLPLVTKPRPSARETRRGPSLGP